jgi:hypothetical protein
MSVVSPFYCCGCTIEISDLCPRQRHLTVLPGSLFNEQVNAGTLNLTILFRPETPARWINQHATARLRLRRHPVGAVVVAVYAAIAKHSGRTGRVDLHIKISWRTSLCARAHLSVSKYWLSGSISQTLQVIKSIVYLIFVEWGVSWQMMDWETLMGVMRTGTNHCPYSPAFKIFFAATRDRLMGSRRHDEILYSLLAWNRATREKK